MRIIPEGEWRLSCTSELFATLRRDKEFALLCTIGRAVNAFKFGIAAANNTPKLATPSNDRHRMGAVLYITGLLHEMLEFRKTNWDDWSGLTAFREIFATLDEDAVDAETAEILRIIRNRAAFHLDPTVAVRVLSRLVDQSVSFTYGNGHDRMDANNDLSDFLLFAFVFGQGDAGASYRKFDRWFDKLRDLAVAFVGVADRVLMKRLIERGFRFEALAEGTYQEEFQEAAEARLDGLRLSDG